MRKKNLKELKELVAKICPGLNIDVTAFISQDFQDMLDSMKPSLNNALNKRKKKNMRDKYTAPDLTLFNPH